ncbi:polymer-forming cytoskeletal protein [Flavobacterium sp. CS20]|uniref:bactofilin family protein n=1 Tax=Flavobacterium sp. CS20 TaxID=2775246 RepID=UPI001B3A0492|nr:polymer-forming cytoskeletal protein [Flavobacterium sp. CS20]QTY26060.1 polymer-forming cytoskeletal protein [Flavobacterium sp. CS20]
MFSDKKNQKPDFSKEQNKISQGTTLTGDITSEGSFRIEGELEGNLNIKGKVVIGETGQINGEVVCENADVEGKFTGTLKVNSCLTLKSTSHISGDVITDQLVVENGAVFNATCQMKGNVKSLDDERKGTAELKKTKATQ